MPVAIPKIIVAMIGARRQYAVPRILSLAGWLERFFTDYFLGAEFVAKLLQMKGWPAFLRTLSGRHAPEILRHRVCCFPRLAWRRFRLAHRVRTESQRWKAFAEWNREFGQLVVRESWNEANGVYVFNAAGLEILERATQTHQVRFLDQTTLPWETEQRLLQEERERWPDWEDGMVHESDWAPLAERERAEWQLADLILCGSDHVRDALIRCGIPTERCEVVPYGVATPSEPAADKHHRGLPLRVLFVGTLELRKGLPYLWQAAQRLPHGTAIFHAVGPIRLSHTALKRLASRIELLGPLPRAALSEEYNWADVLVLPTLSEGSANVCYEAMAHGLPIITTPAAGSVVRSGVEGYIVPSRDATALIERLSELAHNVALRRELSSAARQRAQEFTLEQYAKRLTSVILSLYNRLAPRL